MRLLALGVCFLALGGVARGDTTLTWEVCVEWAGRYHPDLMVAKENLQQASSDVKIARSDTLPSVDLVAAAGESKAQGVETQSSSVGLKASQTLWDGGKKSAVTRSAKAALSAKEAALLESSALVRLNLRQSYLDLWHNGRLQEILETIRVLREKNLRLIKLRYEAGTEHLGAYTQAKAKYTQAVFELRQATREREQILRNLQKAIGAPALPDWRATDPLEIAGLAPTPPEFDELYVAHPAYLQKLSAIESAQASLKAAKAAYGPTLTLSAEAGLRDSDGFSPEDDNLSASVSANWPLFDFGERSGSLQKARSLLRSAQASALGQKNTLIAQMGEAWNSYTNAQENQSVQEEFLKAARERNRIASAQYEVGQISYDNWTLIEDSYVATQKSKLQAELNTHKAEAAWLYALGTPL